MIDTLSGSRICRLMCRSRGWLSICNSATWLLIWWGGFGWLRWWLVVEVEVDVVMLGMVVDMGGFREDVGCVI